MKRRKRRLITRFRRRFRQKRKVHVQNFFNSRIKKYNYYFKKNILKNKKELNKNRTNFTRKFLINFKFQKNKVFFVQPLVALLKFLQRYVRLNDCEKILRKRVAAFPDFFLTAKPKATRMGRGKGLVSKKIYFVKNGLILFEFRIKKFRMSWRKKNKLTRFFVFVYLDWALPKLKSKLTSKISIGYNMW